MKIKLSFSKRTIIGLFLLLLTFSVTSTGIVNKAFGYFLSEFMGLVLTFILCLYLLTRRFRITVFDLLMIFMTAYALCVSLIYIAAGKLAYTNLVGLYMYVIPTVIFLCRNSNVIKKYSDKYLRFLFFFLVLSSFYAIIQKQFHLSFIPWDYWRSTGLMRNTLNYSGIVTLCFFPLLLLRINPIVKFCGLAIILIGDLYSYSRGSLISILFSFLFFSVVFIPTKFTKRKLLLYTLAIYMVVGVVIYFMFNNTYLADTITRLSTTYDFQGDQSNSLRMYSWETGIQAFFNHPLGNGVGQVGSTVAFFVNSTLDLESFMLNIFYDIGVVGLIYFIVPFRWLIRQSKGFDRKNKKVIYMFIAAFIIEAAVQSTYITPSLLVVFWLNVIFSIGYLRLQREQPGRATSESSASISPQLRVPRIKVKINLS